MQQPTENGVTRTLVRGSLFYVDNNGRAKERYAEVDNIRDAHGTDPVTSVCTGDISLTDCCMNAQIRAFDDEEHIDNRDFAELLNFVAFDVYYNWTPHGLLWGYLAGRGAFDTPFYNGSVFDPDQQVCIDEHGCWGRAGVNYFAQGMWAAASGVTLAEALDTTIWWNESRYGHPPSAGELYWTEFGYRWYQNWLERVTR